MNSDEPYDLDAKSVEAALRELRALCGPEPPDPPEIDWDGESPIDGEPVTERVHFSDVDYVFTASAVYRVRPKNNG